MYNVIIADDQKLICEGIKFLINEKFPCLNIVGIYHNGSQTLEAIDNIVPDILISDICMPQATGLDICKKIREKSKNTQIILVSGYTEFEYAKKSIEYQVVQYLVKPYSPNQLVSALSTAISTLESQENNDSALFDFVKQNIIKIYNGDIDALDFYNYKLLSNSFLKSGPQVCLANIVSISSLEPSQISYLEKFTDSFYSFIICNNKLIVFFKDTESLNSYLSEVNNYLKASHKNISVSLENVFSYNEWKKYCSSRKLASDLVSAFDKFDIKNFIAKYSSDLSNQKMLELTLHNAAKILKNKNLSDFKFNPTDSIEKIITNFFDSNLASSKNISSKVKVYIESHYSDVNLSLTQISQHFRITGNYISELFKKDTGETITDYINTTRISHAVELLKSNSKLTHEQIANLVGYNSLSYFYRIFKKTLRQTPAQFRRKLDSDE